MKCKRCGKDGWKRLCPGCFLKMFPIVPRKYDPLSLQHRPFFVSSPKFIIPMARPMYWGERI